MSSENVAWGFVGLIAGAGTMYVLAKEDIYRPNPVDGYEASIKVLEPCNCEICQNPKSPWWKCRGALMGERSIADYEGPGIDGSPFPTKQFIRWVEKTHPGKVYVYAG